MSESSFGAAAVYSNEFSYLTFDVERLSDVAAFFGNRLYAIVNLGPADFPGIGDIPTITLPENVREKLGNSPYYVAVFRNAAGRASVIGQGDSVVYHQAFGHVVMPTSAFERFFAKIDSNEEYIDRIDIAMNEAAYIAGENYPDEDDEDAEEDNQPGGYDENESPVEE